MREVVRALLPGVAVALACMAVLDIWIRAQPLAMPRLLQLILSVSLVAAVTVLVVVVLRVEREDHSEDVTTH